MRLMASRVQRVSSSMLPTHILPFSSLATWPETKMKSPARTAGWNGRFGFFFPIGMMSLLKFFPVQSLWGSPTRPPPKTGKESQHRSLDDVHAALPVYQIADSALVDSHIIG